MMNQDANGGPADADVQTDVLSLAANLEDELGLPEQIEAALAQAALQNCNDGPPAKRTKLTGSDAHQPGSSDAHQAAAEELGRASDPDSDEESPNQGAEKKDVRSLLKKMAKLLKKSLVSNDAVTRELRDEYRALSDDRIEARDGRIRKLEEAHAAIVAQQKEAYDFLVAEQKEAHDNIVTELRNAHDDALVKVKVAFKAYVKDLKSAHNATLEELDETTKKMKVARQKVTPLENLLEALFERLFKLHERIEAFETP